MTLSDALESAAARVTRIALYAQVAEAASLRAREPETVWLSTYAWFLDTLAESEPKAAKADAKKFITDRFLKKLEDEGFVQKLFGR